MYHPRLYGSIYDMGFKYGSLLFQKNYQFPAIPADNIEFGTQCYQEVQKFYPDLIPEFQGFAKGWQVDEARLGAFVSGLGVFDTTGKCSVFAYRNQDSVIFGRNYDMLFEFKKLTESCLIAPAQKFAYISQSDVFIGRCDGINERGLAIALSFVNGTTIQPGVTFHFVIRKVLETCKTVDEAIAVIQNAKVASANNFLIADATGNIAVVETAPQSSTVRYPQASDHFICITNQFETATMAPFDQGGIDWCQPQERYQRLHDCLASTSQMDLSKAKTILSDSSICLDLKSEKFGTIWSIVANLNELNIERAEGKPKVKNYQPEPRLAWWLKKRASAKTKKAKLV